jgi:predicted phage terminase large subunit-like protein
LVLSGIPGSLSGGVSHQEVAVSIDTKKTIFIPRSTMDIVICCDPAISERETAARTAIVVMAMTPYQKMFLLEYWVGRQGDPFKIITTMLEMARFWQPRCIGIEMVAYQKSLEPYTMKAMQERSEWWPIVNLKPDRNEKKEQRILSMQPFFRSGQIYIQRGMADFIEEYETFPLGRTRDILDAMSYAVRLLTPQQQSKKPGLDEQLKVLAREDPMSARYWRAQAVKQGLIEPMQTLDELLDDTDAGSESKFEEGVGDFAA